MRSMRATRTRDLYLLYQPLRKRDLQRYIKTYRARRVVTRSMTMYTSYLTVVVGRSIVRNRSPR